MSDFANKYGLYLDKKGPRQSRKGNLVIWTDLNGNDHRLDFVLERGGTASKPGIPVAFIEAAWRRYTKHSKNKVQEIQGAVMPLFETYRRYHPFTGAILAGVFTKGALTQLKSLGFAVAYFPYQTVLKAFATVGIDASSDEDTPEPEFTEKIRQWAALKPSKKTKVGRALARLNVGGINAFTESLRVVTMRTIKTVRILPLHGHAVECLNVEDAISFIQGYHEGDASLPIVRYEVQIIYINYINGDKISGEFIAKDAAIEFLRSYVLV